MELFGDCKDVHLVDDRTGKEVYHVLAKEVGVERNHGDAVVGDQVKEVFADFLPAQVKLVLANEVEDGQNRVVEVVYVDIVELLVKEALYLVIVALGNELRAPGGVGEQQADVPQVHLVN